MTITNIAFYSKYLQNMHAILEKAKQHQMEHKIQDEVMLGARLTLDQYSLAGQVRSMCNFARNAGAVIQGVENPVYEDNEKTLSDLQARIEKVMAYLSEITEEKIAKDISERTVPLAWMPGKGLTAKYFLETYALSNFYFHYVTAYSILRHYGLQIGKADYMGNVELVDLTS